MALATHGEEQGGVTLSTAGPHASLWRGTPGSWFSLHALLPEEITNSFANAVEVDGDVVRVAGWGHDIEVGGDVALLWVYGSAP